MNELDKDKELELDDLLISNSEVEETKSSSGKKLVLLGAIAVILFVVVIVIVYMLQDNKLPQASSNIDTNKPIEKVESSSPVGNVLPKEPSDFGQMPIQNQNQSNSNGSDEQFQKIIDQIKAQQKEQSQANNNVANEVKKPQEIQKNEVKNTEIVKPKEEKPKVQTNTATTPSDSFKDIKTNDPKLQGSEATTGFYIQVGSFSKFSPNKQLLDTITQSSFDYRMQKAGDNNRLLIGPFKTRQEAKDKLNEVKDRINKDAFIKEIK